MSEAPIFPKTYDLLLWLVPATLKYPREHRYALALRTQQAAFEFNELIIRARKTHSRRELLIEADAKLEQVRLYLRLAHDLGLLTLRQYEHVARGVGELARCSATGSSGPARLPGRTDAPAREGTSRTLPARRATTTIPTTTTTTPGCVSPLALLARRKCAAPPTS